MKKQISIIIPFRNEKEEIYKTIKSIYEVIGETPIEIICIDDNSDDEFDYQNAIKTFKNVRYYKNNTQLGVASSRDKGVELTTAPSILLLDGHMRFIKDDITPLIKLLQENPRNLYCLQSRILKEEDGKILMSKKLPISCGARISLDISDLSTFLSPIWEFLTVTDYLEDQIEIPCIMGAAYAINKSYYLYLHGLNGLSLYGGDEAFLSTKVWMEGGKCILLRDKEAAHIYRKKSPCGINGSAVYYNKMIYAELFLPEELQETYYQYLRKIGVYDILMPLITEIKESLNKEREYLHSIFTHDFDKIINLNQLRHERTYPQ